MHNFCS